MVNAATAERREDVVSSKAEPEARAQSGFELRRNTRAVATGQFQPVASEGRTERAILRAVRLREPGPEVVVQVCTGQG